MQALCGAADRDRARRDGATPLLAAASEGHLAAVRLLCEAGADKDLADAEGLAPLGAAARHGHEEVASLLREAGARQAAVAGAGGPEGRAAKVPRLR